MLKKNKQVKSGFSLIELMVVIVIIGLISTFAIPAYNRYVEKTKFTNVINYISSIKRDVFEYQLAYGGFESLVKADMNLDDTDLLNKAEIKSADITSNNKTSVTLSFSISDNVDIGDNAGDKKLVYTATYESGNLTWSCSVSNINSYYTPKECK